MARESERSGERSSRGRDRREREGTQRSMHAHSGRDRDRDRDRGSDAYDGRDSQSGYRPRPPAHGSPRVTKIARRKVSPKSRPAQRQRGGRTEGGGGGGGGGGPAKDWSLGASTLCNLYL